MATSPAPFGVVDLHAVHDAAAECKLSPPMLHMLQRLAQVGGEMPFSWDVFQTRIHNAKTPAEAKIVREAREAVVELINSRLVREVEIVVGLVSNPRLILRLTDKGRAVLSEQEKFRLVPSAVKPLSEDELRQESKK